MSAPDVAPALREALADALFRAHRFVETAGDADARGRAAAILGGAPGAEEDREAALAARSGEPGEPARALRLLELLSEIRRLRGKLAGAVATAVVAAQRSDGSWRAPGTPEDDDAAQPAFVRGADDPLYLTGALVALLARSAAVADAPLDAAAGFLAARFAPERIEGAPWHGVAAFAAPFSNVAHESADAILQWCGRELEKGFRSGAIDPAAAARVLVLADARALPGASLAPSEILAALIASQRADGSFGAADARASADATLDAVTALLHLAGVRGGMLATR